jgi:hypothetical protein
MGLIGAVAIAATMTVLSEPARGSLSDEADEARPVEESGSTALVAAARPAIPQADGLECSPEVESVPAEPAEPAERAEPAEVDSEGDGPCPTGMVEVEGEYCPSVLHRCVSWINQKADRCAKYQPTSRCFGKPKAKHFCIDEFEFPNQRGAKPDVGMSWEQAKESCEAAGKRLCTDSEWTLACEGADRTPYPDGYVRGTCNQDRTYIVPDDAAFRNPRTRPEEIQRLSQSHPSGDRPDCVSHYGAYDMTGNVDEWVENEQGSPNERPYHSGLKGGYWGPVRNRCRPMTVDHNAWHAGYQIGFRCCADLPAGS